MDHLVVAEGETEVLGECVDQTERQFVVVILAMDRLVLHVAKRVIHPAHIPLDAEPQTAVVGRSRDSAPRCRLFGNCQHTGKTLVRDLVELWEEVNGFQVFATAELVRHPLPIFAAVVQVQHRGDGVDADAIDVIFV